MELSLLTSCFDNNLHLSYGTLEFGDCILQTLDVRLSSLPKGCLGIGILLLPRNGVFIMIVIEFLMMRMGGGTLNRMSGIVREVAVQRTGMLHGVIVIGRTKILSGIVVRIAVMADRLGHRVLEGIQREDG